MLIAGIAFCAALCGITALLFLKRWELTHDRVLFQDARRLADVRALQLKHFLFHAAFVIESLPNVLLVILRRLIRRGAIAFGHLAHWLGERSHDLADLVSHKHRFERKEIRSEFLKQVAEHPIRNIPRPMNSSESADAYASTQHTEESTHEILTEIKTETLSAAASSSEPEKQEETVPQVVLAATKQSKVSKSIRRSVSRARNISTMMGKTLGTAVKKVRRKRKSAKNTEPEPVSAEDVKLEIEA